jgi:hypothetical protein
MSKSNYQENIVIDATLAALVLQPTSTYPYIQRILERVEIKQLMRPLTERMLVRQLLEDQDGMSLETRLLMPGM